MSQGPPRSPSPGFEPAPPAPDNEHDEFLRVEQVIHGGHPVNVIKDTSDHIAFPGPVPHEIQSPVSPSNSGASPKEPLTTKSDPFIPEKWEEKPTASPKQLEGSTISKSFTAPQRPSADKKWATELAPRSGAAGPREPRLRAPGRARTSYIGRAVPDGAFANWEKEGYYSSSSSSSEDEDDDTQQRPEAKRAHARKERRKHEIDEYRRFKVGNENYSTSGKVKKDGRLRITVNETANKGYLAKALGSAMKKVVKTDQDGGDDDGDVEEIRPSRRSSLSALTEDDADKPRLNIVIMVIGSRGDAQPFLKIGKVLKEEYGHRVRIATHPAFREFVEKDSGLEFFSVGGDPSELMAFMVKNPGMIPTLDAVKAGDIGKRRAAMAEMFEGFWRACINATDDEHDIHNLKMMGERDPFVADAIIANPPSFAHIHCAEALGIPLHLMFTFPYTPTQAFPHPLASIKKSNVDPGYTNFISYPLVDLMVWQGLGDLVNDFRTNTLNLDPVSTLWAPGQSYRLHVPFSYLWSPGLVPKPEDWGDEVDVSGFVFLDLASTFTPPDDLQKFLDAGDEPIYIGFGSIVVDDPDKFTEMIFEAVKLAGVRVLLSKGWGGLGGENAPDNVFMLDNTPHDWLFPRVRACVIHGGAGTTAIALKCGKPTMVVPFFGDQHFWGSMLASAGAGPEPVPYKHLSAEKLAEGIKYCLTEEAQKASAEIAKDIELEGDGAVNAVRSFHHHLNLTGINSMRCSILRERVACWKLKKSTVKLSSLAADIAVEKGYIPWKRLELIRHREWNDFEGPGEPVTGVASSVVASVGNAFGGVGSVPYKIAKTSHKRKEKKKKRRRLKEMRTHRRNAKPTDSATNGADDNLHQHVETEDVIPPEKTDGDKPTQATNDDKVEKVTTETIPPQEENGDTEDSTSARQEDSTKDVLGHPQQNGVANNKGSTGRPNLQNRATTGTFSSAETTSTLGNPVEEYTEDVNSGLGKTARAVARAPVDISMAVAQGFHNAPRLYGDDTVRRPPRVTGIKSGLKAAQSEFAYGVYDAFTGVVRLPVRGAKKDGVVGFVKGTGMGLGGFVLKHLAAFAAPVGYTLRGVAKQVDRAKQPDRLVRRARIIEGQREAKQLTGPERKEIEKLVEDGWGTFKDLWHALEMAEKKKGIKAHLTAKKKRGLNAAFESVQIAEDALAAVNRGNDVSTVVGTEKELKKLDENQTLPHRRTSADTERTSVDGRSAGKQRSSRERSRSRDAKGSGQTNGGPPERQKKSKTTEDIPEDAEGEERQTAAPPPIPAVARVRSVA